MEGAPLLEGEAAAPPAQAPETEEEEHDYAKGPRVDRSCTDILCLLLWVAAMVLLGILHFEAFSTGDARRILHGKDHLGRVCGVDPGVVDYPLVYYPSKVTPSSDKDLLFLKEHPEHATAISLGLQYLWGVCTSECPQGAATAHRNTSSGSSPCPVDMADDCTWYGPPGSSVRTLGRYCTYVDASATLSHGELCNNPHAEVNEAVDELAHSVNSTLEHLREEVDAEAADKVEAAQLKLGTDVEDTKEVANAATQKVTLACDEVDKSSFWDRLVADISTTGALLLFVPVTVVLVATIYIVFMRYFAKVLIWTLLLGFLVGPLVAGFLFTNQYWTAIELFQKGAGTEADVNFYYYLAVGCAAASGLVLLLIIFCRNSIRLTVLIVQTVMAFLMQVPSTMLAAPIIFLLSAGWLTYSVVSALYIASDFKIKPVDNMLQEPWRYEVSEYQRYLVLYHLLCTLWVNAILQGLLYIAVAATVCSWYYAPKTEGGKDVPFMQGVRQLGVAVFYHLGSAAFGGLLIAIIQMIRLIFKLFERYMKQYGTNGTITCLIKVVDWALWFLHKVLEVVTNSAYVVVGCTGMNFFSSARKGVGIIWKNMAKFALIHMAAGLLEMLGMMLGMAGSVAVAYYGITQLPAVHDNLNSTGVILTIVGLFAALIGRVYFTILVATADACFFCFFIDEEESKKKGEDRAAYLPDALQPLVDTCTAVAAEQKAEAQAKLAEGDEKKPAS